MIASVLSYDSVTFAVAEFGCSMWFASEQTQNSRSVFVEDFGHEDVRPVLIQSSDQLHLDSRGRWCRTPVFWGLKFVAQQFFKGPGQAESIDFSFLIDAEMLTPSSEDPYGGCKICAWKLHGSPHWTLVVWRFERKKPLVYQDLLWFLSFSPLNARPGKSVLFLDVKTWDSGGSKKSKTLFQESQVCKMFQKSWSFLTCSSQLEDATGRVTAVYLSESGTMTRASLAHFLQACMNFSWTWSILDEASFKIL